MAKVQTDKPSIAGKKATSKATDLSVEPVDNLAVKATGKTNRTKSVAKPGAKPDGAADIKPRTSTRKVADAGVLADDPESVPTPPTESAIAIETKAARKSRPKVAAEAEVPDATMAVLKKRRRRPEEVRERILASALTAFATYGFEGASVRSIAKDAHASLPLVLYHFHSKEELWKTMMEGVYSEIDTRQLERPDFDNLTASERLRLLIADIVRFFANSPSLHRLMTLEGHQITDRLLWMCERHTRKSFRDMTALIAEAQKEGKVRMVDPARLRFAINAMSAVPFAVSAEYQILTNKSPFGSEEIEGTIALINQFVFIDGQ